MSEDLETTRPLRLPVEHAVALRTLIELEADGFATLMEVLLSTTPTINRWEIVGDWCDDLNLDFDLAATLMESIGELARVCHYSGSSPETVAKRLLASSPFDEMERDTQELLVGRIKSILECPDILVFGKAMEISSLHQQVFGAADIYTDLRPIFANSNYDDPELDSGILSHVLRLHHITSDGIHQDFYVAMREEDLTGLRMVLDRAEKKARRLRQWLGQAGMRLVTPEYD